MPTGTGALPAGRRRVAVCGLAADSAALARELGAEPLVLPEEYGAAAQELLAHLRDLARARPPVAEWLQIVVPAAGPGQVLQGLAAALRCARRELPSWHGQVIAVEPGASAASLAAVLQQAAAHPHEVQWRAEGERVQALGWREDTTTEAPAHRPWRPQGVYLITGGLGGLGAIVAEDIARQIGRAHV